jgi:translocation and assembly module TamA
MRRGTTGLGAVCLLAAVSCATTEEKPDGPIVDSFVIEGTKALKPRDIERRIVTSTNSFFSFLWFVDESRFDPNAWIADQRRIERFYQAHGFYQARVVEEEVTPTREGHVRVRVKVEEGQPTAVSRFEVRGLEGLADKEQHKLLAGLAPKEGKPFLEEDWAQAQRELTEKLKELGYAAASLEAQATVDVKTQKAELEIEADVGQRYRFGAVHVQNPDGQVPVKMIQDAVESAVTPGEWYSPEALAEAQARVFQLGVFSAAKVTGGAPDVAEGTVPVIADVRETLFGSYGWGIGIGADQLRDQIHVSGQYQYRNLGGRLGKLTLKGLLGVAALASSNQTGPFALASLWRGDVGAQVGPFFLAHADFEQPSVIKRWLAAEVSLELSSVLEPAYRATGGVLKLGAIARPTTHLTFSATLNPSYYWLTSPPTLSTTTTSFYGCSIHCALVYLEQTAVWDRRDNLLEPRHGWYLGLGMQEGGTTRVLADGSTSYDLLNYIRLLPEGRYFVSFASDRFTIAVRGRLGILSTFHGAASAIPVRFFSGGNDMRGFSARRLSPFIVAANPTCYRELAIDGSKGSNCAGYGDVLPVGGNTLLDGSLELRLNLWESLTVATFMDAGYVSSAPLSVEILEQLNVAVGIGLRYRTPVGPIRVDFAVRLPVGAPLEQQTVTGFPFQVNRGCFFGLGRGASDAYPGSPEGQCDLQLSVGEAF